MGKWRGFLSNYILLRRFGKNLEREHLQYFLRYEGDVEVDHFLAEALKYKNKRTAK